MKRLLGILLVVICSVSLLTVAWGGNGAFAQRRPERARGAVPPQTVVAPQASTALEVKVWTDKGNQEPTYFVGERIYISFTVTNDSYLVLYDVDSTGNVNILFPNPYHPDNLVRKGRVYRIPTTNYRHDLFIKGPTGEEILLAVVSSYAYYHWQYGSNYPPPIWMDEWGSSSTWGHGEHSDYSIASRRFQQRLYLQEKNLAARTVEFIKHETEESVKIYPVTYAQCKFFVTVPPY